MDAEGTGFEPVLPFQENGFRNRRFEPLSQPSAPIGIRDWPVQPLWHPTFQIIPTRLQHVILYIIHIMNWPVLTIFIIFGLSRFLFLAKFPHFYDSPEYLRLSQEKNLATALQKSHESIHPVYLFLIQTSQKFFHSISFISAFFGLLGLIYFYYLVKRLFGKKTAFLSLIPLIFFPHFWLIQTNIMHESVDHFLLIVSLLFFDIFLENKKLVNLVFSLLFFLVAVVNFVGNLIWLPIFFGLFIFRRNKKYDFN